VTPEMSRTVVDIGGRRLFTSSDTARDADDVAATAAALRAAVIDLHINMTIAWWHNATTSDS